MPRCLPFVLIVLPFLAACQKRENVADSSASTATPRTTITQPALPPAKGAALYAQHCAPCHMADGSGVPNMQPALDTSTVVAGDPALLISVILRGPATVLPADRDKYANAMPVFGPQLKDTEIAAILTHARKNFANGASPVAPADVAAAR